MTLELGPEGLNARIRLLGAEGASLPAGLPVLYRTDGSAWVGAVSDKAGEVECTGLDRGKPMAVFVSAWRSSDTDDWLTATTEAQIPALQWERGTPTIEVASAATATFHVLSNGHNVEGLSLRLVRTDDSATRDGRTDRDGRWPICDAGPVPAGAYRLVTHDGKELWKGPLEPGPTDDITIVAGGLTPVRLRLEDWGGNDLKSRFVSVALVPSDDDTDPEYWRIAPRGAVNFEDSPRMAILVATEDVATMKLRIRELWTGSRDVPLPSDGGEVVLQPSRESGVVRVQCRDDLDEPIGNALVTLRSESAPGRQAVYWTRTDTTGHAMIHGVRPGDYGWRCTADSMVATLTGNQPIVVAEGRMTDLELRWMPDG